MIACIRIAAVLIAVVTVIFLYVNAQTRGWGSLYFLWPDVVVSVGLVAAAVHGGRVSLIAAFAAAAGVFITATLGPLWTEGLAATPPGASLGVVVCAAAIVALMRRN